MNLSMVVVVVVVVVVRGRAAKAPSGGHMHAASGTNAGAGGRALEQTTTTTMSPVPTSLQSGLKTMTRNWSENTPTVSSSRPGTSHTSSAPAKPIANVSDARARRMAAIQAALDEMSETSQALKSSKIANMDAGSKRSSDGLDSSGAPKKKRVLPGSFSEAPSSSATTSSVSSANGKPSSKSGSSAVTSQVMSISRKSKAERKATDKPAPIFLSKEQQRVLQLVENGESLFYTGSAGTCNSSFTKSFGVPFFHRNRKVCLIARNHQDS